MLLLLLFLSYLNVREYKILKDKVWKTLAIKIVPSLGITLFIATSSASFLYGRDEFNHLADLIGLSAKPFAIAVALFAAFVAVYFVVIVISAAVDGVDLSQVENTMLKGTNITRCVTALRVLIILMFAIAVACSFSASVWTDEAFTFGLIKMSYTDVVKYTAMDVHPPLYYLLLKFVEDVFSLISTGFVSKVIVGKLFSVVTFALTAALCYFKLRKIKSKGFTELLILCLFSSSFVIGYIVEVRMYGLAMFFVTGSCLYAYDIISEKSGIKPWVLLTIFTLCSAYTHNYALISAAAVWLFLLIFIIANNRKKLKEWFIFGIVTAVCYFPWLLVLLKQTSEVSESYWISDITLSTIIGYINSIFPAIMILVPVLVCCVLLKKGIKNISKGIFAGAFVLVTTLVIGVGASLLIRPVFISRYLVPSYVCIWITIMLCWLSMGKHCKILIAIILVISSISATSAFASSEIKSGEMALDSVALIQEIEDEGGIICVEYVSGDHVLSTVSSYTDLLVYTIQGEDYSISELWTGVFGNLRVASEDSIKQMVADGEVVYYVATNEGSLLDEFEGNCEYLGDYLFGSYVSIYRISQNQLLDSEAVS